MAEMTDWLAHHNRCRIESEKFYRDHFDPMQARDDWNNRVEIARDTVTSTLEATQNLTDIESGLRLSGGHMLTLRYLMAPPISQDQFKLLCPSWQKDSENHNRPLRAVVAGDTAKTFYQWKDDGRVAMIRDGDDGKRMLAVDSTAYMLAVNGYRTDQRMKSATAQETAVATLLESMGFIKRVAVPVDQPGVLHEREFMCAPKFLTNDGSTHEVDIAVGLPKNVVLAIECKVSNDRTNSVKRVNDVLKKANAWKRQWGNYVITGAVLQGVFAPNEPKRLIDGRVEVFWSHRLEDLRVWINTQYA